MFRRRQLYRRGTFRRLSILEPGPRQLLIHANQLKDSGNFEEAAEIYERLARGAENRGMLVRAPHLYLEAAACRLSAKQAQPGIDLMWQGFRLLEKTKRWNAIFKNEKAATAELQRAGQAEAADKLQAWVDQTLEDHPEAISSIPLPGIAQKPAKFPPKCPQCGASVRVDRAEWIDETNLECPYCGSAIQPEE
jgi:ribosomal protein S27AE